MDVLMYSASYAGLCCVSEMYGGGRKLLSDLEGNGCLLHCCNSLDFLNSSNSQILFISFAVVISELYLKMGIFYYAFTEITQIYSDLFTVRQQSISGNDFAVRKKNGDTSSERKCHNVKFERKSLPVALQ